MSFKCKEPVECVDFIIHTKGGGGAASFCVKIFLVVEYTIPNSTQSVRCLLR